MELSEFWFLLVAILFVGFFFLEGFDFGVGMGTRVLAKNDHDRRVLINTIGPFWDANEVWLITAGGAVFAAFPHWYATMFSGYYIPFVFVLLALIIRGVAFEFRGKGRHMYWKKTWDWSIFLGSLMPPFLFGVLFTSMLKGMPIDETMTMRAGFTDFVNLYSVAGGLTLVILCYLHGMMFLTLKTVGEVQERARKHAGRSAAAVFSALIVFVVLSVFNTDMYVVKGGWVAAITVATVVSYAAAFLFSLRGRDGWAFILSGFGIASVIASVFVAMFPRVMVSSLSSLNDLTVYSASSGDYSLRVMSIVAITLLPFVLGYQIWSYYVFRKRVTGKDLTY